MLATRGLTDDAAFIHGSAGKFAPQICKASWSRPLLGRGLPRSVNETYTWLKDRWFNLWHAGEQCGQLIEFPLTARRDARAARSVLRQRMQNFGRYQPMTIGTGAPASYARVVGKIDDRLRPQHSSRYRKGRMRSMLTCTSAGSTRPLKR
ncbi:MAG: DDE-type integrase/transposase/recombinase [Rhodobacteraceae bacterium]|nr:DDE-type integrase/transposase/recombinase [Paracoccaceae bacterium]